jgi:hypothetical protein
LAGGIKLYSYIQDTNFGIDVCGLTGTYMFQFDTGEIYIGKGPINRAIKSQNIRANQIGSSVDNIAKGVHIDWGDDLTGLLVEQELINRRGAISDPNYLNKINSRYDTLENLKQYNPQEYAEIKRKADSLESKFGKRNGKIH